MSDDEKKTLPPPAETVAVSSEVPPSDEQPPENNKSPKEWFDDLALDLKDIGTELESAIEAGDKAGVRSVCSEIVEVRKNLMEIKNALTQSVKSM